MQSYYKNIESNQPDVNSLVTPPEKHQLLDKLAQLTPNTLSGKYESNFTDIKVHGKDVLRKRARAKYLTNSIVNELRKIPSPLHKSYLNTYFCASTITQIGKKLTAHYCGNRVCKICNRIRTAKLINGYKPILDELPDKWFITLTLPNVKEDILAGTIFLMIDTIAKLIKRLQKRGYKIKGIRKLECTYNAYRNDFHPHFHFIMSGESVAEALINEWLVMCPNADILAQDKRPADNDTVMEIFKYFTKTVTKGSVYIRALDTIFKAMHNHRVFQPYGIKKLVSEDIENLIAEIYNDLEERETLWTWIENDWIDKDTGETLSGYQPSIKDQELIKRIMPATKRILSPLLDLNTS